MLNWYRSLIPGRMPLVLAWVVAFLGAFVLLFWIATSFGGGIEISLRAGDTIRFEQVRQGADTTTAHHFTVEALRIDINLDDGRFEADLSGCDLDPDPAAGAADPGSPGGPPDAGSPGGAVDPNSPVDSDSPGGAVDRYEITFPEAGQFIISDCAHPGAHGRAKFVVAESDGGGGRLIVTGAFVVEDNLFVLWTSPTVAQFGYAPGTRVPSRSPGDQLIFFGLMGGSVLAAPVIALTKRRRWWLWGIFGLVGGVLGVGQPFITSATVAAAVLLGRRPRPAPADLDDEAPADDRDEGPPDRPPGPPTEDQRTLPPPPSDPAAPPRPRPQRSRRRPRY